MFGLPEKIVVFDTECTTWEGAVARNWSGLGERRELVQLGAVLVETENFTKLSVLTELIRPKINRMLSDYFINLTGITQEKVDRNGVSFPVFLQDFRHWCGVNHLYCFDTRTDNSRLFDRDVLIENCDLYGVKFPFEMETFHNINEIFTRYGIVVKQSSQASVAFGVESPYRSHHALSDVAGVIEGLRLLKKKVA